MRKRGHSPKVSAEAFEAYLMLIRCLTDKDVSRTDREQAYFAGDKNPSLTVLRDILLTHTVLDPELGTIYPFVPSPSTVSPFTLRHFLPRILTQDTSRA